MEAAFGLRTTARKFGALVSTHERYKEAIPTADHQSNHVDSFSTVDLFSPLVLVTGGSRRSVGVAASMTRVDTNFMQVHILE